MISDMLWEFQRRLHTKIAEDIDIKNYVSGVYFKVPQDNKFPYIKINFSNIRNNSLKATERVKFTIEINICSRDPGNKNLYKISSIVEYILTNMSFFNHGAKLDYVFFSKASLNEENDGVTQIMNIKFEAMLTKRDMLWEL